MKIGILTFHCAHNYGAVLQCYAMQEFLRSKGHDVEIINYRPDYLLRPYRLFCKRLNYYGLVSYLKGVIKELLIFPSRCRRRRGFQSFINNRLCLSRPVKDISGIPSNYDVYIVGSDQVWNTFITQGFDGAYFCDFPFPKESKRYLTYAPSMEAKSLDSDSVSYYRTKLTNFDAISVREESMISLLSPLVNTPIQQVLDPTLMVPVSIWNNLLSVPTVSEKYVLVYQVYYDKNTMRIANHIAAQLSAKVVAIITDMSYDNRMQHQEDTPEEFVNMFRNATCVVTTSFHGTAFSVIFNRPFYTLRLNKGWDTRSTSLLNQLDLPDRMIDATSTPEFTEIDYSKVNSLLDKLRQESQDYLINALTN